MEVELPANVHTEPLELCIAAVEPAPTTTKDPERIAAHLSPSPEVVCTIPAPEVVAVSAPAPPTEPAPISRNTSSAAQVQAQLGTHGIPSGPDQDLWSRLGALAQELIRKGNRDGVATLSLVVTNLLKHPQDDRFRRLRLANKRFSRTLGTAGPGIDFLVAIGFVFTSADAGVLEVPRPDPAVLWLASQALQESNSVTAGA